MKETRDFLAEFEVRFKGDQPILTGYAAVFNSLSHDLGGFREKIKKGAFGESLEGDTYLFWNHQPDKVLARKKSGTLKLKEDSNGLHIEAKPPKWAAGYVESIERGDVTGMSFGFIAEADEWDHKKNIRTLTKIAELPEVSVVTFPAYEATNVDVALRSMKASRGDNPTIEEPERIIRKPTLAGDWLARHTIRKFRKRRNK